MKVPLLDLRRHGADVDAELEEAFRRVLRSGHYILGPEVDALEKECAAYCNTKHAIGVSSGTDAILLALMALGIGPGDEVICPTYTFFATVGTIWRTGAKPVLVDCDPETYNSSAAHFAPKITANTRAIVPVHLFGQMVEMGPLMDLAHAKGISVIEDAAQAFGSEDDGRRAGELGTFGCFSFYPSKNLGALGDAGLVVANDDDLAERIRIMRAHGGRPKHWHPVVGGNFRIDALQAALIRVKLARLDGYTAQRRQIARSYGEQLAKAGVVGDRLFLPVVRRSHHTYNQYVLRVPGEGRRDLLRAFLEKRGIGTEVYYPVPMHLQECFESLGHKHGDFPVAETAARETLALPIFPGLRADEIAYVVSQICEFVSKGE